MAISSSFELARPTFKPWKKAGVAVALGNIHILPQIMWPNINDFIIT